MPHQLPQELHRLLFEEEEVAFSEGHGLWERGRSGSRAKLRPMGRKSSPPRAGPQGKAREGKGSDGKARQGSARQGSTCGAAAGAPGPGAGSGSGEGKGLSAPQAFHAEATGQQPRGGRAAGAGPAKSSHGPGQSWLLREKARERAAPTERGKEAGAQLSLTKSPALRPGFLRRQPRATGYSGALGRGEGCREVACATDTLPPASRCPSRAGSGGQPSPQPSGA